MGPVEQSRVPSTSKQKRVICSPPMARQDVLYGSHGEAGGQAHEAIEDGQVEEGTQCARKHAAPPASVFPPSARLEPVRPCGLVTLDVYPIPGPGRVFVLRVAAWSDRKGR